MASEEVLLIPIRGSEEMVQVRVEDLSEDPADIIDILKAELAPLELWLQLAIVYYRQGNINAFKSILLEGADPALETIYPESKKERIAIINTLAAYYTNLALEQKEKPKRDEYFNQATMNYNKADRIEIREEMTWVGKGVLLLCKGDISRASDCFDNALKANSKNAPALLGKACIYFNKGQIEEALKNYRDVLNYVPNAPANVRLGLAYCYNRLGKHDLAKKSFERVLQMDNRNVEALVGLAILEMNTDTAKNVQMKAMNLIKKAYEINPNNSIVLNHLANHFFYREEYKKVTELALSAYHNTEVPKIRAESCYQIGRSYHARADYENAFKYYFQAVHNWPEYNLALYALGQLYLYKNETSKAINCFETVLRTFPDSFETLRVLGSLYAASNKKDRAYTYLKRATELHPNDVDAWVELAQLLEDNHSDALEAYEKALDIATKTSKTNSEYKVPAELWNNVAVLRHVLKKHEKAEQAYQAAILSTGFDIKEYRSQNVTTTYNLARLYEEMCRFDEAEELYKGILKEHPNYVDCYLRLGCMARNKGQIYEASVWFKDTFTVDDKNTEAWCLLGNLHLQKEEWLPAQKTFERIVESNRNDAYAHLSLGNIYYAAKFEKKERQDKYLKLAYDFYWKVLQTDPTNIYAANGVGVFFAEHGNLDTARDFFIQVREASGDIADAWINLAHVYVQQGLYLNAIKLVRKFMENSDFVKYQNCLKKFYDNKDSTVLLFLARAFYEAGRYDECKSTLLKAIHISPHSKSLWFNLALSQEQYSVAVLRKEKQQIHLSEIRKAVAELRQAVSTFNRLRDPAVNTGPGATFIAARAEKHATYCQSSLDLALRKLQITEELEKANKVLHEQKQRDAEMMKLLKKQEEEDRKLREEKDRLELEREAREAEEKARAVTEQWVASRAPAKLDDSEKSSKKKKRKKEKDSFIDDDEDGPYTGAAAEEQPEETAEEREAKKARSLKELGERLKKKKKSKKRDADESGNDSDRKKKKKKKKMKKAKADDEASPAEEEDPLKDIFNSDEENDKETTNTNKEEEDDDEVKSPKSDEPINEEDAAVDPMDAATQPNNADEFELDKELADLDDL